MITSTCALNTTCSLGTTADCSGKLTLNLKDLTHGKGIRRATWRKKLETV